MHQEPLGRQPGDPTEEEIESCCTRISSQWIDGVQASYQPDYSDGEEPLPIRVIDTSYLPKFIQVALYNGSYR